MIKSQGWDSEERIVTVDISDAKSQDMIAAKKLGCVVKIVEAVRRHIIIRQGHKRHFSFRH